MKQQLASIYNYAQPIIDNVIIDKLKDSFKVSFLNRPRIEIFAPSGKQYKIKFIERKNNVPGNVIYEVVLGHNGWGEVSRDWYTEWLVEVYNKDKKIATYTNDLKDKKILISFESSSLGDTIAWFQYVEDFRKKHKCKIVVSTFYNELFENEYKNIEFVIPGTVVYGIYSIIKLGWYIDFNPAVTKVPSNSIPLQQSVTDLLGLEYIEKRPKIYIPKFDKEILPFKEKYICISEHSTANAKYWHYKNGWQNVVDYLISLGYKVVVLSKEDTELDRIENYTGQRSFSELINIIKDCEFFIGIGSGLSWLAWALKKKVILISGFSKPWTEFSMDCIRIYNNRVCNGCFNRHPFNKADWDWCPDNKNFECSKNITSKEVISGIDKIIEDL